MSAANGSVAPFQGRGRGDQASAPQPDSFEFPGGGAAPPAGGARSRSAPGEGSSSVGPSSGGEPGSLAAVGSGGLAAVGPSPGGKHWSAEAGGRGPSAGVPPLPGGAAAAGGAPSAGGSRPGGGAKFAEAGGEGLSSGGVPGSAEACAGQGPEAGKDGIEELDLTCAHLHSLQGVALPQSLTVGRAHALGFCAGHERFPGSVCVFARCRPHSICGIGWGAPSPA